MEGLEKNIKNLTSMLKELDKAIKEFELTRIQPLDYREITIELIQEGLIKRFELSFGLFWKTLKDYLEAEQSISVASPKKAIHACHDTKLLNDKETELLLEMVDNRNTSTHDYGRDTATAFSKRIPSYHKLMSGVLKKIKKEEA